MLKCPLIYSGASNAPSWPLGMCMGIDPVGSEEQVGKSVFEEECTCK